MNFRIGVLIMSLALLGTVGCTKPSQTGHNSAAPSSDNSTQANSPSPPERPAAARVPQTITIPSGKVLTVQLAAEVGSKTSQPGQSFGALLAKPVEVAGH